jgi:3-oxoacyl-[acyl-carrier protein] reductase
MFYIPEGQMSIQTIDENSILKCLLIRSISRRFGLLILVMKLLQDKVAIITGATRGIGRGLALRFAEEGAHVAFTYMSSEQKARELEAELSAFGVKAKGYNSDAAIFAAAETLVNNVMADFGDLHIVVNNAGITKDGLLMRMSEEQFDAVIQTNLKSVFNLTKASIKPMLKNRFGVFINMSSVVGGGGNAGQANYAASKAGIEGFTKSVAQELGSRNIRSNAIAPGFIETEMTAELSEEVRKQWAEGIPLKRGGTPLDVANVAVFLASDLSAYVNGQVINVCGGMRM